MSSLHDEKFISFCVMLGSYQILDMASQFRVQLVSFIFICLNLVTCKKFMCSSVYLFVRLISLIC